MRRRFCNRMHAYRSLLQRRRLSRGVRRIARATFVVAWVLALVVAIGVLLAGDEVDDSSFGTIWGAIFVLVTLPSMIYGDFGLDFGSLLIIIIGTIPLMFIVGPALLVWCLVSPFKARVLYLRHFGMTATNTAIARVVNRRLKHGYRLIALDDGDLKVSAVGARSTARTIAMEAISTAAPVVGVLVLLAVLGIAAATGNLLGAAFLAPIGMMFVAFVAVFLVMPVVFGALWYGCLAVLVTATLVWRGRTNARRELSDSVEIAALDARLRALGQFWNRPRLFAPSVTVVTVANAIWQDVVSTAITRCEVVLVDVSAPTEALNWELESVTQLTTKPSILIADADSWSSWAKDPNMDPILARTRALIGERRVIKYTSASAVAQKRFFKELADAMDAADWSILRERCPGFGTVVRSLARLTVWSMGILVTTCAMAHGLWALLAP